MDRTRITGYIFIKLSGLGIEQDIKKMLAAGIKLHDCRRESYTSLTARCSVRDGKKLKKLGINAQIIRSGGIIPALLAARTRYGLFAAAAVVTAAIILLQGRVFLLDIKGLDAVSRQDMEEALARHGIVTGARLTGERLDEAESAILREDERLQWISITRRGVSINVTVKEKPVLPQPDYKTPGDMVAGKTALVEELVVLQGTAAVKKGELVLPGQVLISGQLIYAEKPAGYVAAMGYCNARVWYSLQETVPLTRQVRTPTGRTAHYRRVVIMGRSFGGGEVPFEHYSTESRICKVMNMGLPVYVEHITYSEEAVSYVTLTPQEALEENRDRMEQELRSTLPRCDVLAINCSAAREGEDGAVLEICAEVMERIEVFRAAKQENTTR